MPDLSTKPYLIRAIHEWCTDSGHTPYLAVAVDERTVVPRAYVKGGEIVLNVSHSATNGLRIGNDLIEFQARFGGVAHELSIPVDNVSAIYARENGHGMAFEVPKAPAVAPEPRPQAEPARRGPRLATSGGAAMTEEAPAEAAAPQIASDTPADAASRNGKGLNVVDATPSRRRGRNRDAGAVTSKADTSTSDVPAAPTTEAPVSGKDDASIVGGESVAAPAASVPDPQGSAPVPAPGDSTADAPVRGSEGDDGPKDGAPSSRRSGRPRLTRIK